jgi:hypothetical protein
MEIKYMKQYLYLLVHKDVKLRPLTGGKNVGSGYLRKKALRIQSEPESGTGEWSLKIQYC